VRSGEHRLKNLESLTTKPSDKFVKEKRAPQSLET
jgi:hypothetical protein